jgi:hypothetical protein
MFFIYLRYRNVVGQQYHSWLGHYATSQVAGSLDFPIDQILPAALMALKSTQLNRNEYQKKGGPAHKVLACFLTKESHNR